MKNPFVVAASVAVAATLLLAGCAATDTDTTTDPTAGAQGPEGLVTPGVLTACIDPEYAPLEYYANGSDGEIIGFDADGIRALAEHWGVEVEMLVTSFDGLMPQLQAGACDMIFGGLYMTDARLEVADAAPVMLAGPAVLTRPELVDTISDKLDLCGLRVAAQAASANAATVAALNEECAAEGLPSIALDEYPKTAETVLAVLNGKADVLVETNVAAAYMETQNEGQLVVAADVFPLDTTFGVFSRKGDPISPAIAEGLAALRADGTMARIAEEYNLDPATTEVD